MPFLPKGFEWVIILLLVLIIFGPKNLPKLGKAIGSGLKGLRKGVESGKEKIDEKFEEVEEEKADDSDSSAGGEANEIEVEAESVPVEQSEASGEEPVKRTVRVKRVVRDDLQDSEE